MKQPNYPNLKPFAGVIRFAANWHRGQRRKYTGEPYISHPLAVAEIVRKSRGCGTAIAAAILHDVVEDTPCTLEVIEREYGRPLANAVWWLTDDARGDRNRLQHKQDLAARWKRAPQWVREVKMADLLDNSKSIMEHDPKFGRVYLAEKAHLIQHLVPLSENFEAITIEASYVVHKHAPKVLLAALYGANLPTLLKFSKESTK